MGFLDDLKRQAEATRAQRTTDVKALERQSALADAACRTAFNYLSTLGQQLNVLNRHAKAVYRLDRRHTVTDARLCHFHADARRKRLRDDDVFDHVVLRWRIASDTPLQLTKDFLPDIEQLESRLRQGGVHFDAQAVRDPESAKLKEMRYAFVADFSGSILVTPEHDVGRVRFEVVNVGGLETVTFALPAFEIGTKRLDEFSRWLLGEPNAFLADAQGLRRIEA